jgi:twitching motility protein PilT
MARIDSILSIVVQQGANELRVASGHEPKMLAYGIAKRLAIPKMDEETVRSLLGDIVTAERAELLRANGKADAPYDAGAFGSYHVTLTVPPAGGISAIFVRAGARPQAVAVPPPVPAPAPAVVSSAPMHAPVATPSPVEEAFIPVGTPRVERAAPHALASLVARAASMRGSDLHFADRELPSVRVDGVLRRLDDEAPGDVAATLGLDARERDALARGGAVDLGMDVAGIGRVRVHAYTSAEGLVAAVRLLPPSAPAFGSLNMPVGFEDVAAFPHGLVLVCGATGSGKSTTLAAIAQESLKRRSIVLVTLEDPIEYALSSPSTSLVRRRQIRRDAPDFASGLRDALREDPDVLLVGEMRDPETIALALTAAETGHLVLASLHSRSTASAVERIVDAYPGERQQQIRVQLADSLRVVIGQRLVPRARGSGRIPALEVLRVNHAVASMIREGKTAQIASALQAGRREGMLSLERCLADRVQAGEIRVEDARAAANDVASLTMYLGK